MHPSKFGDTYEMAKICMLRWLEGFEPWGIHPMYFPEPDDTEKRGIPPQLRGLPRHHLRRRRNWDPGPTGSKPSRTGRTPCS